MEHIHYPLMEIARIGALFLPGDMLEHIMPEDRREYPLLVSNPKNEFALGDEVDFEEENFNTLKRLLLLTERIDPVRRTYAALWIRRPENPLRGEVMVAGGSLPAEGFIIQPLWPEIIRAFEGHPTLWKRNAGETVYYPVRNSDEEIVGVLELTENLTPCFI